MRANLSLPPTAPSVVERSGVSPMPDRVLHIDSKVLDQAEAKEEAANTLEVADQNSEDGEDNGGDDNPVERKLTRRSRRRFCGGRWTRWSRRASRASLSRR